MRLALAIVALLGLLTLAPTVTACDIAWVQFDHPTFEHGPLRFVDGESLRRVELSWGATESTEAEGTFLHFATVDADTALVTGQDGLGADCSGREWLRLMRGGAIVWERKGDARVYAAPGGPYVVHDGAMWRLDGDDLVRIGRAPFGEVSAWRPDGDPILREEGGVHIGDGFLPVQANHALVAVHEAQVAVLEASEDEAVLHIIEDGMARAARWPIPHGGIAGITWADGWGVIAGGRAYLVQDSVLDLGLQGPVSITSRAGHLAVFTATGLVEFTQATADIAWERDDGTWRTALPDARFRNVDVSWGPLVPLEPASGGSAGEEDDVIDIPGPSLEMAVLALAVVALRRQG